MPTIDLIDQKPLWKDITSYSQGEKERVPTTYEAVAGTLRIVITNGHIYHKGEWVAHIRPFGIDTKPLKAKTLDDAKAEAIRTAGATIRALHKDYEDIFEASV